MNLHNQLIYKTNKECDLSFKYTNPSSRHNERDFSGIPLIMHSNGTVCWEATDYLLHRYDLKQTIAKNTLEKYARNLSRIVSFLDYSGLSFNTLVDSDLNLLVEYLQKPKFSKNKSISANNQINKTLYILFKVLIFLQKEGRVTKNKISTSLEIRADINVEEITFAPKGSHIKRSAYNHPTLLPSQNSAKRRPITESAIIKMHEAIFSFTENEFIQQRWANLLQTMESTGARESEIANLRISSVNQALNDIKNHKTPRLAVITLKGGNIGSIRKIPVTKEYINDLNQFILFVRNPKLVEASIEHDFIFITNKGVPMTGKRIYDHFKEVRDETDLKGSDASPHLFRNKFITKHVRKRLKSLLEKHGNYKTGIESFVIKKVKQLTGHKSDSSIWPYVDDLMYEFDSFKKIEEEILALDSRNIKERQMRRLLAKAKGLKTIQAKAKVIDELLSI